MDMFIWLRGLFTDRGKSLSMYRSGMAKANKADFAGAIADYSVAIQSPKIPPDVKAMAIYNRSLAYSAIDEDNKAAADLASLLKMPGLPENIQLAAQQRRSRISRRFEGKDYPKER
jgi:hypothetical protein